MALWRKFQTPNLPVCYRTRGSNALEFEHFRTRTNPQKLYHTLERCRRGNLGDLFRSRMHARGTCGGRKIPKKTKSRRLGVFAYPTSSPRVRSNALQISASSSRERALATWGVRGGFEQGELSRTKARKVGRPVENVQNTPKPLDTLDDLMSADELAEEENRFAELALGFVGCSSTTTVLFRRRVRALFGTSIRVVAFVWLRLVERAGAVPVGQRTHLLMALNFLKDYRVEESAAVQRRREDLSRTIARVCRCVGGLGHGLLRGRVHMLHMSCLTGARLSLNRSFQSFVVHSHMRRWCELFRVRSHRLTSRTDSRTGHTRSLRARSTAPTFSCAKARP